MTLHDIASVSYAIVSGAVFGYLVGTNQVLRVRLLRERRKNENLLERLQQVQNPASRTPPTPRDA